MYLNHGNIIFFMQYNASHLFPLNDQQIVSEASSCLIKCIGDFEGATVIQQFVRRSPGSAMHFLPGRIKFYPTVMYVCKGKILLIDFCLGITKLSLTRTIISDAYMGSKYPCSIPFSACDFI
jgi:hypothetical protein